MRNVEWKSGIKKFSGACLLACTLVFCQNNAEKNSTGLMLGPLVQQLGGSYIFNTKVNKGISSFCATSALSANTTNTNPSDTTTQSNSDKKGYDVTSYLTFYGGQNITMRFRYLMSKQSFTLSPLNTSTYTCKTTDYKVCNSTGIYQCKSADGVKCGGTYTFIFSDPLKQLNFQAYNGTISWPDGIAVSEDSSHDINKLRLNFLFSAEDSTTFSGSIYCDTSSNRN